jgi:hypothetical protein
MQGGLQNTMAHAKWLPGSLVAWQFGRHQIPVSGMVPYFSSFVFLSFHLFQLELDLG